MRRSWVLAFLLLLAAAPLLLAPDEAATADEKAGDKADASATLFEGRCATCHAVPDTGLWMDRAWLDQVNRTT